ncbi:hypothetical protein HMPREF1548_02207 [Clostridium sp. KLE 1755]|nr:hypothetical protein HMPREF1548_02207 [Clostridium sp. KLE 1755]
MILISYRFIFFLRISFKTGKEEVYGIYAGTKIQAGYEIVIKR